MTPLKFIVEPAKLLLTWQPPDESGQSRIRRVVGEVVPSIERSNVWQFRYVLGTTEMELAEQAGFQGHPAFKLNERIHTSDVRETFLRRLPPRTREDFADFLRMHRLPVPFIGSDLALLGYTGAKLPSDGFAFVPVFPASTEPCEYILEVAGVRHVYTGDLNHVQVGDPVSFEREHTNEVDENAVLVLHSGARLGYVNRALLPSFAIWMDGGELKGTIERKNGSADRPLVYVRVRANCPSEVASFAHSLAT